MLPTVDSTREVTRVDELQARRRPDLARAKQRLGRGVVGIGHPVVLVERGDVPRNFGAHGGHVVGGATQLGVVVVEPRNHEGHELEPEPTLVHHADSVEHVLQHTAELTVAPIIHRLEVDLVAVGPRADEVQDLRGRVAVGDERGLEPLRPGRLEHLDRPFGGDERLVVRRAHQSGSLAQRQPHQAVWRHVGREHARGLVAQRLAREPVLTVATMEVAPQHAEGERVRPGQCVEEGLFLGRIALQRGHVPSRHVENAVLIEAYLADAAATGLYETAMSAGEAAHRSVR